MAQVRRPQETGSQVVAVSVDVFYEPGSRLVAQCLGQNIEVERKGISRLWARYQPAVRGYVFFKERVFDPFKQSGVVSYIFLLMQYRGCVDQQLGGVSIKTLRDEKLIGDGRRSVGIIVATVK